MTETAETTKVTGDDNADARRIIMTLTGQFERKLLSRMVAVTPPWVTPALWVQNTWFSSDRLATLFGVLIRQVELIGIGAGLVMESIVVGTMFGRLRQLAKLEPPGVVRD